MIDNKKLLPGFLVKTISYIAFFAVLLSPLPVNASHTSDEPDVTTRSAIDITNESAVLNGRVDGNASSTHAWFEYGRNRDLNDSTFERAIGSGTTNFSVRVSGLREDTIYYFRVVAENDEGIDYGNIFSFRTDDFYSNVNYYNQIYYENDYYYSNYDNRRVTSGNLTAITDAATEIGNTSAQLNSLILTSVNNPSNAWFEWGATPNLGNRTVTMSIGSLPAIRHAHNLTGLVSGRIYYFRAVAENSSWRNNGSVLSFVTGGGAIGQNVNTIIVREPVIIEVSAPTTIKNNSTENQSTSSLLGANISGAGFLPVNLLGWLLLFILILMAIMLVKYIWDHSSNQKYD